jgi:4-alpha-glucanotransferase
MTNSSRPPSHLPVPPPFDQRRAGLLLHPTALPGGHGSGDLGPAAHDFVDFLAAAGQRYWQMLPVCPAGAGNSPYDSPSASAISETLLSLTELASTGLVSLEELAVPPAIGASRSASLQNAIDLKRRALSLAHQRLATRGSPDLRREYDQFLAEAPPWLEHHATYMALKAANDGRPWVTWDVDLRDRKIPALSRAQTQLAAEIDRHRFAQFELHRQWSNLRQHCRRCNVLLMGDVPIYVAHDSADVWANREVFVLSSDGHREVVAGVPPDYFSSTGQLWGNPLYRWSNLQRSHYAWWVERLRTSLRRFDAVRLDHFIGFRRYWEVPATAKTAEHGRFVDVPGERLLTTVLNELGSLPFLAEDLGVVTDEVHALRNRFSLPGMRILQFAFDDANGSEYLPHRYVRNTTVYTGTHDNDTTVGWFHGPRPSEAGAARWYDGVRERVRQYLGADPHPIHWQLIRLALGSVANTAIIPVQDLLGLGSEARMNTPGTSEGNWKFRLLDGELTDEVGGRLRGLTAAFERLQG